jgi:hypothetical protein
VRGLRPSGLHKPVTLRDLCCPALCSARDALGPDEFIELVAIQCSFSNAYKSMLSPAPEGGAGSASPGVTTISNRMDRRFGAKATRGNANCGPIPAHLELGKRLRRVRPTPDTVYVEPDVEPDAVEKGGSCPKAMWVRLQPPSACKVGLTPIVVLCWQRYNRES